MNEDKYHDRALDALSALLEEGAFKDLIAEVGVLNVVGRENLVECAKENLDIEEVYSIPEIEKCFLENFDPSDYVDQDDIISNYICENTPEDAYGADYIFDYVRDNWTDFFLESFQETREPQEIFTQDQLEAWALANGFVAKEDAENAS